MAHSSRYCYLIPACTRLHNLLWYNQLLQGKHTAFKCLGHITRQGSRKAVRKHIEEKTSANVIQTSEKGDGDRFAKRWSSDHRPVSYAKPWSRSAVQSTTPDQTKLETSRFRDSPGYTELLPKAAEHPVWGNMEQHASPIQSQLTTGMSVKWQIQVRENSLWPEVRGEQVLISSELKACLSTQQKEVTNCKSSRGTLNALGTNMTRLHTLLFSPR